LLIFNTKEIKKKKQKRKKKKRKKIYGWTCKIKKHPFRKGTWANIKKFTKNTENFSDFF